MARNKYPEETIKLILDQSLKLFMEKGYDKTSIQDIIDHLGGLSRGAIYHHFKSKEEIFEGVCQRIGSENSALYENIREDKSKNGFEKLKSMIRSAYLNPNNDAIVAMTRRISVDSKFLSNQIQEIYELVVPQYIEPVIRQGVRDGSIQTDHPKELAEVIITLLNVWVNPLIAKATRAELEAKFDFFNVLLHGIGIDLLDEEDTNSCVSHCARYIQ